MRTSTGCVTCVPALPSSTSLQRFSAALGLLAVRRPASPLRGSRSAPPSVSTARQLRRLGGLSLDVWSQQEVLPDAGCFVQAWTVYAISVRTTQRTQYRPSKPRASLAARLLSFCDCL